MISIIGAILPVLLKMINSWVDNQIATGKMKKEAKDDFLKFIKAVDSSRMADLRADAKSQSEGF